MRAQLGAVELIELGKPRVSGVPKRPYLLGYKRLGEFTDMTGYLTELLDESLETLALLVDSPILLTRQGVAYVRRSVADLLRDIPAVADVPATVLLVGDAVIRFGIDVPERLYVGLQDVLLGVQQAFDDAMTRTGKAKIFQDTKNRLVGDAPMEIQRDLDDMLSGTPAGEEAGLVPKRAKTSLETAMTYAVPGAIGAGLLVLLFG